MDDRKQCVVCGKEGALALFGIALGLVFLYMSVDVLMGGKVTASLTGARMSTVEDGEDD